MARLLAKGRPQHIPSQTDTVVRFVQEHVAVFLRLCELVKRSATRLLLVTTPLRGGGPQHIPSQTDTVVRFVQEHVAVFLCLCD